MGQAGSLPHWNEVPSVQMQCRMTANLRATATCAFFIPLRLASRRPKPSGSTNASCDVAKHWPLRIDTIAPSRHMADDMEHILPNIYSKNSAFTRLIEIHLSDPPLCLLPLCARGTGRTIPLALRPARKRKLIDGVLVDWGISIRRAVPTFSGENKGSSFIILRKKRFAVDCGCRRSGS